MAYKVWLGTVLLLAGCAPRVILSEDDGSGSSTGEQTETAEPSDGSNDNGSPATTQPPMPTVGPMSTTGPTSLSSSGGFDSSGFFGSSSGGEELCWSVQPWFEAPEESRLFVRDQDGDGLEELWLAFFEGGGPGGGSELFWFDTSGQPNPAGFFPGFFTGFHDLDGDGVLEAMGLTFGGGGPPNLSFISGTPLLVEGPPQPTPYDFEDGFEAFLDIDNDGLADFLRTFDGLISLEAGNGAGGFEPTSSVESEIEDALLVRPVQGSVEQFVVSGTNFFDDIYACNIHPIELMGVDGKQLAFTSPIPVSSFSPSEVLGAEFIGGATHVYFRGCSEDAVTLMVQRFDGIEPTEIVSLDFASFAAYGDFDGDGDDDATLGTLDFDGIESYDRSPTGEFEGAQFFPAVFGEPVPTRVFVVDIDGDGREEIILGTLDGGPEIAYLRLDREPC